MGIKEDMAEACGELDDTANQAVSAIEATAASFDILDDAQVAVALTLLARATLQKRQGAAVVAFLQKLMPTALAMLA